MIHTRRHNYASSGKRLLQYLNDVLDPDTGYPDKPSWGYAFTYLASLTADDAVGAELSTKARRHLECQDKADPNYSWEFVVYALQTAKKTSNHIPESLDIYRQKGTRMFNWYLLRTLNRKLCNRYNAIDYLKLRLAASVYQKSSGLILDEFKTRSLQYHAFCLFVLAELIETDPKNSWLRQWFSKGIEFSLQHILNDGTSLYIGRGQEQIFGYGALIYSLEYCHGKIRPLDENRINQVSERLLSFQRDDGSYPLVLRNREPEPSNAGFSDGTPSGWYGYNTLYDYQPFLAYCLIKAGYLV